jgi:hypothetical protein
MTCFGCSTRARRRALMRLQICVSALSGPQQVAADTDYFIDLHHRHVPTTAETCCIRQEAQEMVDGRLRPE